MPRVLIVGGNAFISRLTTRLMVARSWDVTSIVRQEKQAGNILKLAHGQTGKVEVLYQDLETMQGIEVAKRVLSKTKPDFIFFAAGSICNPYAVDRDAARNYMKAAAAEDSGVRKFLFMSFPASRRARAPWWSESDYRQYLSEKSSFPDIQAAKLDADEYLVALAHSRARRGGPPFQAISLRPTWMTNAKGTGHVNLGKAGAVGSITREDVASTVVALLSREDTAGWYDQFEGDVPIDKAVDAVVAGGVNAIEGEELDRIYRLAT